METPRRKAQIRVRLDPAVVHPPLGANFFHFTRLGGDIAFQVGFVSIPHVVEALDATTKEGLPPEIEAPAQVHELYQLSLSGFSTLYKQVREFAKRLEAEGQVTAASLGADEE